MTKAASVTATSVVGALILAWLWFHPNQPATSALPETDTTEPESNGTASAAIAEDGAPEQDASFVETADERVAKAAVKLADMFNRGVAPNFVDYLTSKGLSREDSEQIVAEGVRDMATCLTDEMRAQAYEQGVRFEDPFGPGILARLFFSDRARICMTSVQQRMGLPSTVKYEFHGQGSAPEFEAWVVSPD